MDVEKLVLCNYFGSWCLTSFSVGDSKLLTIPPLNQPVREGYLSNGRAVKVQASLRICAVTARPSLFAHTMYGANGSFSQRAVFEGPFDAKFPFCRELSQLLTTLLEIALYKRSRSQTGNYDNKTGKTSYSEPMHEKTYLCCNENSNAQNILHASLISAFIIRCLISVIPIFAISEIRNILQASI